MNWDSHLTFIAIAVADSLMVYFMFPDLSRLCFIIFQCRHLHLSLPAFCFYLPELKVFHSPVRVV